jgi:hypothetical protein
LLLALAELDVLLFGEDVEARLDRLSGFTRAVRRSRKEDQNGDAPSFGSHFISHNTGGDSAIARRVAAAQPRASGRIHNLTL